MRAIVMLHSVDDSGSVLSVTQAQLCSLVLAVRASGHTIVPLSQLLREPSESRRIALSFDDGLRSLATHARPVLSALGAPATLFLTTGYVGRDNHWPSQPESAPRLPMMSWDELAQLKQAGWDIEAHTTTHPDLRTLDTGALERELCEPIDTIAQQLGHTPALFAYPYGYFDERVRLATARHYRCAVSTRMALLDGDRRGLHALPRLDAYYFRSPAAHEPFGGRRFATYVQARALLRRLRKHPGEC
ncbi:MAG TPA: polysaccharide deacetylase family protein [Polyangiales bacterium]